LYGLCNGKDLISNGRNRDVAVLIASKQRDAAGKRRLRRAVRRWSEGS
jgi:hypothetical protein